MKTSVIVGRLVELIAFLFALFSGYLTAITPPEEVDATDAKGIASFIALLILLILTVVCRLKWSWAKIVLFGLAVSLAVVAITAAFTYRAKLRALTFAYPPGTMSANYVVGTEYTPSAQEHANKGETPTDIVARFGGMEWRDLVWTPESRRRAASILIYWYVVLIVSLFASIFCLTEGVLDSL